MQFEVVAIKKTYKDGGGAGGEAAKTNKESHKQTLWQSLFEVYHVFAGGGAQPTRAPLCGPLGSDWGDLWGSFCHLGVFGLLLSHLWADGAAILGFFELLLGSRISSWGAAGDS